MGIKGDLFRLLRRRPKADDEVWIVYQDETAENTVLGVFETEQEADAFAAEVEDRYPNSLVYTPFPIGYRCNTVIHPMRSLCNPGQGTTHDEDRALDLETS